MILHDLASPPLMDPLGALELMDWDVPLDVLRLPPLLEPLDWDLSLSLRLAPLLEMAR